MTQISQEHLGSMLAEAHGLQTKISSSMYSHDVLELAIATAISFRLSHHTGTSPVWLLIVGAPSGDKTNTIGNLRKAKDVMFIDSLTENGLASGYVDPDGKTKRQDVLSQLTLGCLVIKDLTTLFSMRPERVRKILGEFSTIFDGEFIKPSGAGEGVAWDGHFSFLGCITPQCLAQHYRYMGKIGGRFLLYRIPRQSDEERAAGFARIKTDRTPVKRALAETVRNLVGAALQAKVAIADGHDGVLEELAAFLALGRAVPYWTKASYHDDWELEDMQIEEPYRIFEQLRTLSHALALIHGRSEVTDHEIALLRRVVLSSVHPDRAMMILHLRDRALRFADCEKALRKSYGTMSKTLRELDRLGIVESVDEESTGGRPPKSYRLADRFNSLFPDEEIAHDADLARL